MRRSILVCLAALVLFPLHAPRVEAEPSPPTEAPVVEESTSARPAKPAATALPGKTSAPTEVPAGRDELPAGLAKPIARLLTDLKEERISGGEAAEHAIGMVTGSADVPKRYRLPNGTTELDLMILGAVAGEETGSSSPQPAVARRGQEPTHDCVVLEPEQEHLCTYTGQHAGVFYVQEDLSTEELPDEDNNGIPDYIEKWAL